MLIVSYCILIVNVLFSNADADQMGSLPRRFAHVCVVVVFCLVLFCVVLCCYFVFALHAVKYRVASIFIFFCFFWFCPAVSFIF